MAKMADLFSWADTTVLLSAREYRQILEFKQYHEANPHIYIAFKRFAFEAINAGRHYLGAGFVVERMRWETMISGDDEFKLNNNYRAYYARLFMDEYPDNKGFFRTRKSAADNGVARP